MILNLCCVLPKYLMALYFGCMFNSVAVNIRVGVLWRHTLKLLSIVIL